MKRSTWIVGAFAAVAAVAALGWAFAPRPIDVELATVTRGRFEAWIEEDAKTRVRDRYVVSAPLAGQLVRISLREGDAVQAGDVVATLLPALAPLQDERTLREQQIRVDIARANAERAKARVERADVAVQQAGNEALRSEQLAQQGFVAATKLENDRLQRQAAERERDAAREERQAAVHEVAQARAALEAVSRPGGQRAFALRAPVAGQVLRVALASEATVALGAPLVEIGDTSRMELVAELLTTDALQVAPGSAVVVERWGGDATLAGRVRSIEPGAFTKVSALGVEEQRVRVLIDITTPQRQWRGLGDGFRVGVRIVSLAVDDVLRVPVSAVFPMPAEEGGSAVFVLDDGRAKTVPVDVAARNGEVAWVRRGLEPGARVIVYPPAAVIDGERVRQRRAR
jgi:HlyD family secretion protein